MTTSEPSDPSTIFVLIEIVAPDELATTTGERFVEAIRTAPKPGFVGAQIFADAKDHRRFFSLQEWESEEAFDQHMRQSAEGLRQADGLLARPPTMTILRDAG